MKISIFDGRNQTKQGFVTSERKRGIYTLRDFEPTERTSVVTELFSNVLSEVREVLSTTPTDTEFKMKEILRISNEEQQKTQETIVKTEKLLTKFDNSGDGLILDLICLAISRCLSKIASVCFGFISRLFGNLRK